MKTFSRNFLKTLVHYDPETGHIKWILRLRSNIINGKPLGRKNPKGYLIIDIIGTRHRAHRLAWLYMTGEWPKGQIDHENNIKHDNRWVNLRLANNQLNHYNLIKPKNNTSGAKGVRDLGNGSYSARIKHNQREVYLGVFPTLELASEAYLIKAKELANEFANDGARN